MVMKLLRETLQQRVMTMIGDETDDVEEVSRRQMEANQFRSQILREVMEILQSEIPEEGSNSAHGFEYSYRRGRQRVFNEVDPFNEATATPSFENETVFLSDSQREYEAKRQQMNEEFFASLRLDKKLKREEKEEEEDEDELLYTNLDELMKGNDPSIKRYDQSWEWDDDPVMREWLIDKEQLIGGYDKEEEKSERVRDDKMTKEESVVEERRVEDNLGRKSELMKVMERRSGVENDLRENDDLKNDLEKENESLTCLVNESLLDHRNDNSNRSGLSDSDSDSDPIIIHTSTDGSILVTHSSTMLRESLSPSTTLITSFTEALAKDNESLIPNTDTQTTNLSSTPANIEQQNLTDSSSPITSIPSSQQQQEAQKELFARLIHASPSQLRERREGLLKQYRHFSSQNAFVSEDIVIDITEILRIFGIPFVFAPGEAEAQCAFLEMMGLVDGVISNDSDVFAFGGKTLYKDFFVDNQYVQAYKIEDIEKELGLNRERIIEYAILEGCDYCDVAVLMNDNR